MKRRHSNPPSSRFPDGSLRPSLLALSVAACFAASGAFAAPAGPSVAAGAASFSQMGSALSITNTPGAIINWNSFSIGALESVRFLQQNSLSSVLNRVTGGGISTILGELTSNGRVWLVNPNGILFGAGSRVDVQGLIASTLNISDQDFLANRLAFQAGTVAGNLQNAGELQAGGGNIYLIAPDIENSGILRAPNGEAVLAAGRQVSLVDTAHPDIQVVVSAPGDRAVNLGEIAAGKVSVFGALVQQGGRVAADRVEVDEKGRIVFRASQQLNVDAGSLTTANGISGGSVTLQSLEDAYISGTIEAKGSQGQGGTLSALGNRIAVMDRAVLDTSGETGGGRILVGGDYQGNNPDVQNATVTYFGPEASLRANAGKVGAGGTAIVWANDTTRAYGTIEAKGGTKAGNGGFVEVSGKGALIFSSQVDTSSPRGIGGTLLLDPTNIVITGGTGDGATDGTNTFKGSSYGGIPGQILDPVDNTPTTVYESELEGLPAATSIILQASNSVTTSGTFSGGVALPLNSSLSIRTSDANGGGITLGTPFITSGTGSINLNAGNSQPGTAQLTIASSGGVTTANTNILLWAGGAVSLYGPVNAGSGQVQVTSATNSVSIATLIGGGVDIQAAKQILDNNGNSLNIAANSNITLQSANGTDTAGTFAISLDTQAPTVNAYVQDAASYGKISLRHHGTLATNGIISYGSAESDIRLTSTGAITIGTAGSIRGNGTTDVRSSGNITVSPNGEIYGGGGIYVNAGDSVNVNGGSIFSAGDGSVIAGTYINVAGQSGSEGSITVVGDLFLTATTGRLILTSESPNSGSAVVHANSPLTLYLDVPGVSSDGYWVDGSSNVVSSTNPNTRITVGALPAIVGSNFLITYGVLPTTYSVDTVLDAGYANHTYGQVPTAAFTYNLSPVVQQGETVSGTATFTPSIDSLTPAGTFMVSYAGGLSSSIGSSFVAGAGLTYTVNPAVLTALLTSVTKVYDGNAMAALAPSNFLLTGFANGDGASVIQSTGTYVTKNVGNAIAVNVSLGPEHFTQTGDTNLANYILPTTVTGLANITQRPSVTWVGGASGNWSLAGNWEAGALPDFSNVAQVIIPTGSTVIFDGLTTNLSNIQSAGTVLLQNGSLDITGNFGTAGYQQNGGLLTGTGSLTVTNNFSKSGGSIALSGLIELLQANGNLVFSNDYPLRLGAITANNGNILIDTIGKLAVLGPISAPAGTVTLTAHSPLVIDDAITAQGGISLTADSTASSDDNITLNAPLISSGGDVTLFAGDNLLQNANISTQGGSVAAIAETGSLNMAAGFYTQTNGGMISYAAPTGNIQLALLDAGAGAINLTAGGNLSSAPGQIGPNIVGGVAQLTVGGNASLSTNVFAIGGTVGGTLYIDNNGTVITNVTEAPALASAEITEIFVQQTQQVVTNTTTNPTDPTEEEEEQRNSPPQGAGSASQNTQGNQTNATPNYCN